MTGRGYNVGFSEGYWAGYLAGQVSDAAFIAHAREDVVRLLATVRSLQQPVTDEKVEAACIEWYSAEAWSDPRFDEEQKTEDRKAMRLVLEGFTK